MTSNFRIFFGPQHIPPEICRQLRQHVFHVLCKWFPPFPTTLHVLPSKLAFSLAWPHLPRITFSWSQIPSFVKQSFLLSSLKCTDDMFAITSWTNVDWMFQQLGLVRRVNWGWRFMSTQVECEGKGWGTFLIAQDYSLLQSRNVGNNWSDYFIVDFSSNPLAFFSNAS